MSQNIKLSCLGAVKRTTSTRPEIKSYAIIGSAFDRSGSMHNMQEQSAKALFELVKSNKENAEKNNITMTLSASSFDDRTEKIFDNQNVKEISITMEESARLLKPRGCTRLYATAVEELQALRENYQKLKADHPECTATFFLMTDGMDNASGDITSQDLANEVNAAKAEGIICLFTGADQEAISTGGSYGFEASHCLEMSSSRRSSAEAGFRSSSAAMLRAVTGDSTGFTQVERQASIGVSDDESDGEPDTQPAPPRRLSRNLFGAPRMDPDAMMRMRNRFGVDFRSQ
jgi:hypothetical protein